MIENAHILLTGGTGFFGKALLRYWAQQAHKGEPMARVTLLSRDPRRFAQHYPRLVSPPWLQLIQGDICDVNSLPKGNTYTHVLHAAADSTAGRNLTPQERFDQIVCGTRNILELAVSSGARRFLLTSSGGVYGAQSPDIERITEDCHTLPDPLDPANAYSVAKRMAEHLCALYAQSHGLEIVVARCFAFVGPDLPRDVHFAIGNFIRDALHADAITVQGDGSPLRSYLDQRDLAHWLATLLMCGLSGEAYNVGSEHAVSILELAHTVRDLIAPNKPVCVMGDSVLTSPRNRYIPCTKKAQNGLGLRATVGLEDAIRFAARTYQGDSP
ncbi:MAG: UDP-glucose 4-epimerase [Rhodoferax ferrireducens]|uniref:UDP-glucose 4-epimerase n=1 Tax=Rhodoferax ferrireducens TaxID=192843 RepID=A0A1W9KRK2_9BURK|nr:MAG: UDP-glucose 4-epimerase [Rhodoferax ferrireducens]